MCQQRRSSTLEDLLQTLGQILEDLPSNVIFFSHRAARNDLLLVCQMSSENFSEAISRSALRPPNSNANETQNDVDEIRAYYLKTLKDPNSIEMLTASSKDAVRKMRDAWKTEAAKDAAKDAPKTEAKENKKGPRTRRSRSRSPMRGGISRDRSRSRSRERIPDPDPAPAPAAAPVKGKEGKEEKEPYIVEYQKKQKTTTTQDVITVGRRDGCDVVLSQSTSKNGVSRIHAIICLIPEFNKVVVVDPGSFHGITAVTAGELPDGKHDEKKTPIVGGADTEHKLRGVAVFDYSSTVCLKLGKVPIVLNPKMCVICCTRTRNVKFSCGHQVSCNECAEHIRETAARQRDMGYKCPLCRALLTQPPMAVQFVCISHASSF